MPVKIDAVHVFGNGFIRERAAKALATVVRGQSDVKALDGIPFNSVIFLIIMWQAPLLVYGLPSLHIYSILVQCHKYIF